MAAAEEEAAALTAEAAVTGSLSAEISFNLYGSYLFL